MPRYLIIFFIFFISISFNGCSDMKKVKELNKELKKEVQVLKEENKKLKKELDRYKSREARLQKELFD